MTQIAPPEISVAEIAGRVLGQLEAAWNRGDGRAFGAAYAADAWFVNIRGEHHAGRAGIAAGHAEIFATVYAGSTNRMELLDSREVGEGVVVAISRNTLTAPHGPLQGTHAALSTSVLVRTGSEWLITTTHNTLVAAR